MHSSASVSRLRQPWVWGLLALTSLGCAILSFRLFPEIFPVISLDIRMDRARAIQAARDLAAAHKWSPADSVRDVASFGGDPAQSFIELEGGGKAAFASLLRDELYSAYTWRVRLFKESETTQTTVQFRPGGEPYEFAETLKQNTSGAALTPDQARVIAENSARGAPWRLPLEKYQAVETSQVKRPGGRIDHTFTYERPDRKLGEGRIRLRLVVSGDRFTALNHFIKVPEAFSRRYEEMRSANNAIAAGGSVTMVLLYIVGGCLGGFLFLLRQRAVLWRQPLVLAAIVTGVQLAAALNAWPLQWLNYDTALSAGGFISERLVMIVTGNLVLGLVLFLSFLAAEGLSRRAFPHHPQLWRMWSADAAPTLAILGRTLLGYLLASVMLLYVVVFYYFALGKLGWWSPSEALVDPDSLAHYWPWLTPLANAAQAGIWEETLFRAIPLAGAALLGNWLGGRKRWLAGAFLLQAVVFAACHANYPGQPAYSRLVEIFAPALVFGALYLRFGLLPSIVMHFTYDAVLMALPLFAASASGIWLDRTMVVLLGLVPLWVELWRRWQAGRWNELPAELHNGGWHPPAPSAGATETTTPFIAPALISERLFKGVLLAGVAGLVAWLATVQLAGLAPPLQIGRTQAIELAQAELARRNVKLPSGFRADASVAGRPGESDRFAWQTAGKAGYQALVGSFVPANLWQVRFVSFEGDVAERAEEWRVHLNADGTLGGVSHQLPEARPGATLAEPDARKLAQAELTRKWQIDPARLVEVSATSAKRPKRLDWTFVYRDPAITTLGAGQARFNVTLAGDEVVSAYRFVFVPEDWERSDRALQTSFKTGAVIKGVCMAGIFLTGIGLALVAWGRKKLAGRFALGLFGLLFCCMLVVSLNRWPATMAGFSTAQPLQLQQIMSLIGPLVGGLFVAGGISLLAGLVARWLRPSPSTDRRAALLGAGTGLAVGGGVALATLLPAGSSPSWQNLSAAVTYVPWLASPVGALIPFFSLCIMHLFIFTALDRATDGWRRQRPAAVILLFVVLSVLQLTGGATSIGLWLGTAATNSALMVIVYVLVLRHDLTVLPLVLGVSVATGALADGFPRAFPGALPADVLAAATLVTVGWWLTRSLRVIAAAHAVESTQSKD